MCGAKQTERHTLILHFIFFMNIFVAKLSGSTTGDDLNQLFSEYGEVKSAKVVIDRETGNSKRFGFVEMTNDEEAYKAIEELNEAEYDGSKIVVKKARPKEEGGGGNRGGGSSRGGYNKDFRSGGGDRENRGGGGDRGGFKKRY